MYFTHHEPRNWSGYPDCFHRKRNRQVPNLSRTNDEITFHQLCLKSMNILVLPNICWFQTVRLVVNILTRTSRLCWNGIFAKIKSFNRLHTYMMGKCTSMNVCYTFLNKKQQTKKKKKLILRQSPLACNHCIPLERNIYIKQRELSHPWF